MSIWKKKVDWRRSPLRAGSLYPYNLKAIPMRQETAIWSPSKKADNSLGKSVTAQPTYWISPTISLSSVNLYFYYKEKARQLFC